MKGHKNTIKKLNQEVKKYQKILQNLHEGYILVDEDGVIIDVNAAYCNMVGYSKEELFSMNLNELRPGMSMAYQKEFIEEAVKKGSVEFETQHCTKSGCMIDLKASAAIIKKEGKIFLAGVVRDITQRKNEQRQLEESRRRFQSLFEHNPHSVYYMDLEGHYLGVNSKMEQLTGYTEEELLALNFTPLITEKDLERTLQHFEEASKGRIQDYEIVGVTKQGTEKPVRITNFPMIVDDKIIGVFGIAEDITVRKQAEQKREESEQRFKSLFEHNPHPVYYFDLEGNFKEVNQKLIEFTGCSRKELLQKGFVDFIDEKDLEETKKHFQEAKEGVSGEYEITVWVQDGVRKEVRVTKFPMYVNGKIAGIYGILQDITDQKIAEQKLKESEDRWHKIVEKNPKPVQITVDAEIVFINKAGVDLYGAESREQLMGKSVLDFTHPEVLEQVKQRKYKLENNLSIDPVFENKMITLSGKERYIDVHSVSITYKGKEAIQTVIYDITERKLASDKIKESENLYSAILATALDAIVTIDHQGKILEFNKTAEQIFGYKEADVQDRKMGEVIVPSKYREAHKEGMKRYLETGESNMIGRRIKMEAMHADGSIFPIELSINRILGTDPPKFTGFIRNITERLHKEQRILESLEEKKIMLQEIHHRVKNNMAVISGLLELQSLSTDNTSVQEILQESQMRIYSMAMIHEKLYASESLAEINFDEYAKDLVEVIKKSIGAINNNVTVRYRLDSGQLNVNQAIPCALILNEFIVNCYKHAFKDKELGSILITFSKKGKDIAFSVEDDGRGLPDNFDIEKQQSLGMTIIKTLTKQLEADLKIKQRKNQQGTCFIISFTEDN